MNLWTSIGPSLFQRWSNPYCRRRHPADRRSLTSGFTVIELLAVVAIIVLLAALLFPALSSAKESGRRVVCASNLRQWGVVAYVFAQDNNDWFPQPYRMRYIYMPFNRSDCINNWNNPGTYGTLYSTWLKYGLTDSIALCPSRPEKSVAAWGDSTWWGYVRQTGYSYVGGNWFALDYWGQNPGWGKGARHNWNDAGLRTVAAMATTADLSEKILAADIVAYFGSCWGQDHVTYSHGRYGFEYYPRGTGADRPDFQNVLYGDGRVEGKPGKSYYPDHIGPSSPFNTTDHCNGFTFYF